MISSDSMSSPEAPINRSATSDVDEHRKRSAAAMTDADEKDSGLEKKSKENDSGGDGSEDDHNCRLESDYKPNYPYYENALEIPDGQILEWIIAAPDERPTEEQMKAGFFDTARQYLKELRENGGFHITAFPYFDGIGNVIPAKDYFSCEEKMHKKMKALAMLSLEKNNCGAQFVVTGFGQVNMIPSYLDVYFINFHAQDVMTGVIKTFKARVAETENADDKYVVTHFSQTS